MTDPRVSYEYDALPRNERDDDDDEELADRERSPPLASASARAEGRPPRMMPSSRLCALLSLVAVAAIAASIDAGEIFGWVRTTTTGRKPSAGASKIDGGIGVTAVPPDSVSALSWLRSEDKFDWSRLDAAAVPVPTTRAEAKKWGVKTFIKYDTAKSLMSTSTGDASNDAAAAILDEMEGSSVVFDGPVTSVRLRRVGRRLVSSTDRCRSIVGGGADGDGETTTMKTPSPTANFTALVLGGSISRNPSGYASLLERWMRFAFPSVNVRVVNAAVGATGGDIPSYCLSHILGSNGIESVDLVISEFSVNPTTTEDAARLHRRIDSLPGKPAHVVLDLFTYNRDPRVLCPPPSTSKTTGGDDVPSSSPSQLADPADVVGEALRGGDLTVLSDACALRGVWGDDVDVGDDGTAGARSASSSAFRRGTMFADDRWHPNVEHHMWIGYVLVQYVAGAFASGLRPPMPTAEPIGEADEDERGARRNHDGSRDAVAKAIEDEHDADDNAKTSTTVDIDGVCRHAATADDHLDGDLPPEATAAGVVGGLCLTNWTYHTGLIACSSCSDSSDGGGFQNGGDVKNPTKQWYESTSSEIDAVGSSVTISVAIPPHWDNCRTLAVGYMKSGKYRLGSADVYVNDTLVTVPDAGGRVVVDTDVPYSVQRTWPIDLTRVTTTTGEEGGAVMRAGRTHRVTVVVANETHGGEGGGHRFILTGLYC